MTEGLIEAHKLYGNKDAIIVKVEEYDVNQYDHLFPLHDLSNQGIGYESYSFKEMLDLGELDENTGAFKM